MASKKTASSPSFSATTTTDEMINRLLYTDGLEMKFGEVSVNDINSPNGVRKTDLFTDKMFGPNGEVTAVEGWGKDAKKLYDFFNSNNGHGRLYLFSEKDKSLKQFVDGKVTGYQKNNDGVTRKFVLGTIDGSPKKDLQLRREAMPTPVAFTSGPLTIGDFVLDDPTTWMSKAKNTNDDEFKEWAEPISLDDIFPPRKARKN